MMDFQFEQSPWEAYLTACQKGASVSAWSFISMLEGEDDEAVEDAFQIIGEKQLVLDFSSFPKTFCKPTISTKMFIVSVTPTYEVFIYNHSLEKRHLFIVVQVYENFKHKILCTILVYCILKMLSTSKI